MTFYALAVKSVLTKSITAWYSSCGAMDRKALHGVIHCAANHQENTAHPVRHLHQVVHHQSQEHKVFRWMPSGKLCYSCLTKTEEEHLPIGHQDAETL